ncbi:MAG TPA: serine hydrolase domain-containing protein, partial [Fimbriimonadaceae bacterium]|nr:serine hydrolase domain-containing protein [Fimbriimonadaceae bacterium]
AYTDALAFYPEMREPPGPRGFLDLVGKLPLDFAPGSDWKYDNSGYFILGLLIEKLTGKSFAENLQERICRPLAMTHTAVNDWRAVIPHRARGYEAGPNASPLNTGYIDMGWPFAAGAMVSTVGDLAKWDAALYTDKPVKQSLWKLAWTPAKLANGREEPYGFGWALGQLNHLPIIEHAGAINGFNGDILRVPSKQLTVIVLCNAFPGIAVQISRAVVVEVDPSLKVVYKAISDPDPSRTKADKALLESFAAGNANEDLFTSEMKARLFPGFARQLRQDLGALGPVESFTLVKIESKQGLEQRHYHAVMGGQDLDMVVVTNSAGTIAAFSLTLT